MHASCFNNAAPFLVITCAGLAWQTLQLPKLSISQQIREAGFNNTERMDDQQCELEVLKLKFQKSEAARENQWGEIESLKKQGEESNVVGQLFRLYGGWYILFGYESIELSWLFGEPVMEWSDLSFFWVVYGVK